MTKLPVPPRLCSAGAGTVGGPWEPQDVTGHEIEILDDPDLDCPPQQDAACRCSRGEDRTGGEGRDAARNAAGRQCGDDHLADLLGTDGGGADPIDAPPGAGTTDVIRWARAMLEPGAAVILDVETTDLGGAILEVAVIDACTGDVMIDALVNPGTVPISPEAFRVHGISDADVATAFTWPHVLPTLIQLTRGRRILSYNSGFDRGRVRWDCDRYQLDSTHLGDHDNWDCLMAARSAWLGTDDSLPLHGCHRAVGDTHAARDVLIGMSRHGGVRREALFDAGDETRTHQRCAALRPTVRSN
jgi:DNA polymerase III epsilon subunit-like protein